MKLKLTLLPSLLLMVTLITAGCNTGIPTGETERLYKPDTIGEFDEYQFSWGINLWPTGLRIRDEYDDITCTVPFFGIYIYFEHSADNLGTRHFYTTYVVSGTMEDGVEVTCRDTVKTGEISIVDY